MKPTRFTMRNLFWLVALTLTLWLTWKSQQADNETEAVISPTQASDRQLGAAPQLANDNFTLTPRTNSTAEIPTADTYTLFSVPRKAVSTGSPRNLAPAIKPEAPPLPMQFLGLIQEQNTRKLIVSYQDDVAILKVGDTLAGYQLTALNQSSTGLQAQFLYLPMHLIQTMVVNHAY